MTADDGLEALKRVKVRIESKLYDSRPERRLNESENGFYNGLGVALDYVNTEIHGWKK